MDEIRKNKKHHHDHHLYLPQDIVEDILLRLPLKSLLRLRSVCKQWKTTISDDDRFADAHLRLSRNSLSTRLLEESRLTAKVTTQVVDVSGKHLRVISAAIDPPPELLPPNGVRTITICDGLQLMYGAAPNAYVLWNPSNRTYKPLSYPYPLDDQRGNIYGICYDPTAMNNYKVVIGGVKGYAVFNCRTNSWSEMREARNTFFSRYSYGGNGASFDGSIYWGSTGRYEYNGVDGDDDQCEIVCFDGRDEKLKTVRKFDTIRFDLHLVSSPKALYVYRPMIECFNEIEVMKMEVGDEASYIWLKIRVLRLPVSFTWTIPKCWIHQDKILLEVSPVILLLLYDHATGCVEQIQNTPDHPRCHPRGCMLPPMDNIFSLTTRNDN